MALTRASSMASLMPKISRPSKEVARSSRTICCWSRRASLRSFEISTRTDPSADCFFMSRPLAEAEELLADDLDVLRVEDAFVGEVDDRDVADGLDFQTTATRLSRHRDVPPGAGVARGWMLPC